VALSSAALAVITTGAVIAPEEPFRPPIRSEETEIVSGFGKREVVLQSTEPATGNGGAKFEMHEGVDYGVSPGTEVRASKSGKVLFAGFSKMYVSRTDKTDQHRLVIIRHADGDSSRYVHLSALRVRPGQEVKAGQVIGVVAESDEWVTPVLHFEIRDVKGRPMDPELVMPETKAP
jgi:murein DD-endopeptidase MepM/ murein hydrolase activator NlpD